SARITKYILTREHVRVVVVHGRRRRLIHGPFLHIATTPTILPNGSSSCMSALIDLPIGSSPGRYRRTNVSFTMNRCGALSELSASLKSRPFLVGIPID